MYGLKTKVLFAGKVPLYFLAYTVKFLRTGNVVSKLHGWFEKAGHFFFETETEKIVYYLRLTT